MITTLPERNRLVYLIQTKLQTELPHDLLHDIDSAMHKHSNQSVQVYKKENEQWKTAYFHLLDKTNAEKRLRDKYEQGGTR